MSKLELLIIHCTATPEGRPVSKADIVKWHTSSVQDGGRGWKQVGYSDMIHLNGLLENLVPYNENDEVEKWEITNGAVGTNAKARHIVYVGGTDKNGKAKDTRTLEQVNTLKQYVLRLIELHPRVKIAGHNQFAKKDCPSFHVPSWLRSLGVSEVNIYKAEPLIL